MTGRRDRHGRRARQPPRAGVGTRRQPSGAARVATLLAALVGLVACTPMLDVVDDDAGSLPPLHPAIDDLPASLVALSQDGDTVEVAVRVAADDASRRRGLMEVENLPDGAGMLFVFGAEREGGFWMWNTRIPLDIAFAGADGTVHTVATMVPCGEDDPTDCPITAPDAPYVTALEVPAGWFDRVGLGPGTALTWSEPVPPRP